MYEDTLFDKFTLQKEIDNLKLEYNKLNDKFVIETNELKQHLKNTLHLKDVKFIMKIIKKKLLIKLKQINQHLKKLKNIIKTIIII